MMKQYEKILKALANRRRLAIIKYLKQKKEAAVTEISGAIALSFKATSRHLAVLYNAEILEKNQRSLAVYYSIVSKLPTMAKLVITEL